MGLSKDQLTDYLEVMNEKTIKAMESDFKIHGFMIYQCECCNSIYVMWLEEGLEDSTGKHKPVPFEIVCPACGGEAHHKFWNESQWSLSIFYRSYKDYISQQERLLYRNFFWNDPESDCGVPIIFEADYPTVTFSILNSIFANMTIEFLDRKCSKSLLFIDENTFLLEETSVKPLCSNRYERRHPNKHEGYKRSRSNKKLYEY